MSNIKCFEFGLSTLLDASLWIKWFSILANIGTCVASIIAILAAVIAYKQLHASKVGARNSTAYSLYQGYLNNCITYPKFAEGMLKPTHLCDEYKKYRWFVSSMLFTFEQILEAQPDDKEWKATIKSQLLLHKSLLKHSRTVKAREWSFELHKIIDDTLITNQ